MAYFAASRTANSECCTILNTRLASLPVGSADSEWCVSQTAAPSYIVGALEREHLREW